MRGTPNLRGCPSKKIHTHASFKSNMTNYISTESFIYVGFDKNIMLATFSFTNGQEPINCQTPESCFIEFIGYRMPWKDRHSCTVLFTKNQSTEQYQAFTIFGIVSEISAS